MTEKESDVTQLVLASVAIADASTNDQKDHLTAAEESEVVAQVVESAVNYVVAICGEEDNMETDTADIDMDAQRQPMVPTSSVASDTTADLKWACPYCNSTTYDDTLVDHIVAAHPDFTFLTYTKQSPTTPTKRMYYCSFCGIVQTHRNLLRHIVQLHPERATFALRCELCDQLGFPKSLPTAEMASKARMKVDHKFMHEHLLNPSVKHPKNVCKQCERESIMIIKPEQKRSTDGPGGSDSVKRQNFESAVQLECPYCKSTYYPRDHSLAQHIQSQHQAFVVVSQLNNCIFHLMSQLNLTEEDYLQEVNRKRRSVVKCGLCLAFTFPCSDDSHKLLGHYLDAHPTQATFAQMRCQVCDYAVVPNLSVQWKSKMRKDMKLHMKCAHSTTVPVEQPCTAIPNAGIHRSSEAIPSPKVEVEDPEVTTPPIKKARKVKEKIAVVTLDDSDEDTEKDDLVGQETTVFVGGNFSESKKRDALAQQKETIEMEKSEAITSSMDIKQEPGLNQKEAAVVGQITSMQKVVDIKQENHVISHKPVSKRATFDAAKEVKQEESVIQEATAEMEETTSADINIKKQRFMKQEDTAVSEEITWMKDIQRKLHVEKQAIDTNNIKKE